MNHYYSEIIRIGNKFNLDSNTTKIIFDYNREKYPNHYEIELKTNYNIPLKLKCCILGKSYFQNECDYCDKIIKCNHCEAFYKRYINHKKCNKCNTCVDDKNPHFTCIHCNNCHIFKDNHRYCTHCNGCHNDHHFYCVECNDCYNNNLHKYHNPESINNKQDMIGQIKFYLSINDELVGIFRTNNILILCRLSVKFCQLFNVQNFIIVTKNKIIELLDRGIATSNQEILLYKYQQILEKHELANI